MITIIQILLIMFALFAWSRAGLRLRDNSIRVFEFVFWSFIWAGVIVFAAVPYALQWISDLFGIQRATDFAIYVSIVVLFYLVFRLYVHLDKQDQAMTKLVREIAIRDAKRKK